MRLLAQVLRIACAAGFTTALALYCASFFGVMIDNVFGVVFALALVIIISVAALYVTPKADVGNKFFLQQVSTHAPRTLKRIQVIFFALFLGSFAWFLFRSEASSPEEKNGDYFLDSHGKFVRTLSKSEYLHLKADELRLFATGLMCAYSVVFGYWTVLSKTFAEPAMPMEQ